VRAIWLHPSRTEEAEKIEREVLAVRKRVLGAEHPDTLTAAGNLAASLSDQGKYDEAEKIEREVLAVRKRVLGADHPETLTTAGDLGAPSAASCAAWRGLLSRARRRRSGWEG